VVSGAAGSDRQGQVGGRVAPGCGDVAELGHRGQLDLPDQLALYPVGLADLAQDVLPRDAGGAGRRRRES
jgi:hypothetical protein